MLETRTLAEAYRSLYRPLFRHISGKVVDPETAADIVQEVFLKAHRSRHLYRPEHAVSAWLWAIAKRLLVDHLRGKRVRPDTREVRGPDERAEPKSIEEIPSARPNAENVLLSKDRRKAAFRLLRPLTRPQRRVFLLRAFRHFSYEEIAHKLGMSLSAVKALAHRARRTLELQSTVYPTVYP
jgi:RNA polymerase sigma-70 factor, ECF subfamily